jgi:hypothetical protein
MSWLDPTSKSVGQWPIAMLPFNPDAHVITNVGRFMHCRQDRFCRCRKCKPPLHHGGK